MTLWIISYVFLLLYLFRIPLESNYIKIEKKENIGVYEYTIDFDPPVDARSTRFYLLNQHKNIFPVKTYDGIILFLPTKLQNNVIICNF